jgi:hypothetical protein
LFPKLLNILNNNQTIGEVKPSYARTLSFKLTVRDNRLNGGGVTNNDTPYNVEVINTGQAFAVTSPNVTGIIWQAGGVETVTWDGGGSDIAPVSTPLVNILLSTDGGQTFPTVLASQVPNNGSYSVNVPATLTTTARVMVEGDGNIFFDINDKNFEIGTVGVAETAALAGIHVLPNPFSENFEIVITDSDLLNNGVAQLELTDLTGRLVGSFAIENSRAKVTTGDLASGLYHYRITFAGGKTAAGKLVRR